MLLGLVRWCELRVLGKVSASLSVDADVGVLVLVLVLADHRIGPQLRPQRPPLRDTQTRTATVRPKTRNRRATTKSAVKAPLQPAGGEGAGGSRENNPNPNRRATTKSAVKAPLHPAGGEGRGRRGENNPNPQPPRHDQIGC